MTRHCSNCRFWAVWGEQPHVGDCQQRPPVIVDAIVAWAINHPERSSDGVSEAVGNATRYPRTEEHDKCGWWEGPDAPVDDGEQAATNVVPIERAAA